MSPRPPRDLVPNSPVVVVEGGDEDAALGLGLGVPKAHVWSAGGRDKVVALVKEITRRPNARGVPAWAVILDATDDPSDSLRLAQRALEPIGAASGLGWTEGVPRLGVHLLPESGPGGLESHLVAIARRIDPTRAACVDALFDCSGAPRGTIEAQAKAWVTAWTATIDPKLRPLQQMTPLLGAATEFGALRTFLAGLAG